MFRALKIVTVLLTLGVVLASSQTVKADLTTYEMGPYDVVGVGNSPGESYDLAWVQLYEIMFTVDLPEGHQVLDFVVESEAMIQDGTYEITFHLIIGYNCPPGPPQGGGGGGGF